MLRKKFWLVLSVLVVFGMLFTACAPAAEPPSRRKSDLDLVDRRNGDR